MRARSWSIDLSGIPAHSQTLRNVRARRWRRSFSVVGAWFALSPAKAHASQDAKLRARREKLIERRGGARTQAPPEAARRRRKKRRCSARPRELERVVADWHRGEGSAFALSRFAAARLSDARLRLWSLSRRRRAPLRAPQGAVHINSPVSPARSSGCSGRTAPASPRCSPFSPRCSRRRKARVDYGDRTARAAAPAFAPASACSATICFCIPS